ncbi:hypothetical protein ABT56_16275 [Photobacterium aquae]|uniref:Pilus assembly protein n=1 Tax=Photobacterium aquae TaxID=1195763 RepID=A0A0J1JPJ7_9GAMM|nr:Flp family type IVb pilin [Photobacterium aquae]KLV04162.1 hypothetical protein ABT56_16275 [Photobacterium aquae]
MLTSVYAKVDAFLSAYKNDERGVTAIEYGLIGVAMAVVLGTIFAKDGSVITSLTEAFTKISDTLSDASK